MYLRRPEQQKDMYFNFELQLQMSKYVHLTGPLNISPNVITDSFLHYNANYEGPSEDNIVKIV